MQLQLKLLYNILGGLNMRHEVLVPLGMERQEKPYEELGLSNYFIFGKVMKDKNLCKQMLECLTGRLIDDVTEITIEDSTKITYDSKDIRYDVYVEDLNGNVYDAEMQNYRSGIREQLPFRSRFYQGMIDFSALEHGMPYSTLKDSYVIFICTFDPFKRGKGCYYFSNICHDEPTLSLNDGRAILFFNTKGDFSNLPDAARDFLNYLETGNVDGVFSQQLDSAVEFARHNRKWRAEYMKTLVYNNDLKNEGREEGRIEGRNEGAIAFIHTLRKLNIPDSVILENLVSEFNFDEKEAKRFINIA